MKGCNHRFNDSDSTLKMLPKRELTFPQIFYFQCEECNKFFKVKKNQMEVVKNKS